MSVDAPKLPLRDGYVWHEIVYNGQPSTWDATCDEYERVVEWRGDYDPAFLHTRRGPPDVVLAVLEVNAPEVFVEHDRVVASAAVVAFAERVHEWKFSAEAGLEFEMYDGQFAEQEFDCVHCGGEGWREHGCCDDDEDEVGPCGGCRGTGIEPIEGRLDREAWMDEQVLRHARGERTLP